MLRNIQLGRTLLKATSSELIETFYRPALNESSLYQRGTAYFSIEFLLGLMDSMVEFVYKGGVIHLVTSVELDENTLRSFVGGYLLPKEDVVAALHEKLERYLRDSKNRTPDEESRLDVIANMIAAQHLIIKIATAERGIYHEKIGIFTDAQGDSIAFYGSANETVNAFFNNYETLTIGSSWGVTSPLVGEYKEHFRKLWTNEEPGVAIYDLPSALEKKLIGAFKKSPSLDVAIQKLMHLRHAISPIVTKRRTLHDYQRDAIDEFVLRGYHHLFEMATGTGKTFTAVKAIERMTEDKRFLNVIVLVPLVDLQRQWEKAIGDDLNVPHRIFKFGGCGKDTPIRYRMSTQTASTAHQAFATIAICVYDTFFSSLHSELTALKGPTLLVVDEAHNLTMGNVAILERMGAFRLGLSATPQRYSKKETKRLVSCFVADGEDTFKYTLEKAIEAGFLSHYKYYPLEVELTEEERDEYTKLSKKIAALYAIYQNEPNAFNRKRLEDAMMLRSRIVKKAKNKIGLLEVMVSDQKYDFHNAVVFCGPGKLGLGGNAQQEKIVDLVTRAIGCNKERHYFPAKYTSGEADRPARLDGFKQGLTDTLVAVKCFDEGLDVPALDKIYIMASDSSVRQTIQRRGRVLRVSKDTGKAMAYIYDMVAGERIGDRFFPLQTELPRVYEYSRIAENPEDSVAILGGYEPEGNMEIGDIESDE